ncbi:hypothetical protein B296_00050104 [Ensete ventricosum]|uniref:Bifunctional inhibitor/plant lipid transfer protein/seed storage helical domain-containing protein n=1 Tax=Ensete ventricosum TaxID=4639 RepID=A0A426YMT2_ENSVE|nr:hypothetical protein B296_00050104 [Ensete ventricosum]
MGLVLVLVAVLCAGASAQSSGCTSALVSLSPCLNYITGNETTPSSSCCSQLTSVVGSEPQCLCMVLNGGASSLGITINQTQAMALPAACKIKTPPVSECSCKHITHNSVTTATVRRNVSPVLAATFCLLGSGRSAQRISNHAIGAQLRYRQLCSFSRSCEFSDSFSDRACLSTANMNADGGSKTLPTLDTSSGSRAQVPSSIVYSLLFAVASLWVSSVTF